MTAEANAGPGDEVEPRINPERDLALTRRRGGALPVLALDV